MSSSETMEPGPRFQGSLEKQGRIPRTWKKYWFILKDDLLIYVKNQEKANSSGQIEITTVQSVKSINGKYGYPFEIVTKSKTHYLSAATIDLRDKWIKVLHDSMAWCGRRSTTSTSSVSSSRLSSSSSSMYRASCNSVSEMSDTRTSSVSSSSPSALPNHRSSGYGSTASQLSDSPNDQRQSSIRHSGSEDLMVSREAPADGSREWSHVGLRRLLPPPPEPYSILSVEQCPSGYYDSVFSDEGLHLSSIDKGYVNVNKCHQDPEEQQTDVARSADLSANIAISHILQGYANIKRNTGPTPDDNDPDHVDDRQSSGASTSVVMRRSTTSRMSEGSERRSNEEYHDDNDDDVPGSTSGLDGESTLTPSGLFRFSGFPPVHDLPNPRLELTYRTCFDEIRQFLASNRGPDDFYTAVDRKELDGRHVKALKEYLAAHC